MARPQSDIDDGHPSERHLLCRLRLVEIQPAESYAWTSKRTLRSSSRRLDCTSISSNRCLPDRDATNAHASDELERGRRSTSDDDRIERYGVNRRLSQLVAWLDFDLLARCPFLSILLVGIRARPKAT